MVRAVKHGVWDMLTVPFTKGMVIGDIPLTEEDTALAGKELERVVCARIFEEISREEVDHISGEGNMVSSSFVA